MRLYRIALAASLAALIVAGCAAPSDPTAMIASGVRVDSRSAERVHVDVIGGRSTLATGASQIANDDFATALRKSIVDSRLFRDAVSDRSGKFQLSAFIAKLTQPIFGLNSTVEMEVHYTLTDATSGRLLWEQPIKSRHTASFGDASAVARIKLANEGAARRNIEEAIEAMGKLGLR